MTDFTLPIPEDIYQKMLKYQEINWSDVIQKTILLRIKLLEDDHLKVSTAELLEMLGTEFQKELQELSLDQAITGYDQMRNAEWKRISTIRTS